MRYRDLSACVLAIGLVTFGLPAAAQDYPEDEDWDAWFGLDSDDEGTQDSSDGLNLTLSSPFVDRSREYGAPTREVIEWVSEDFDDLMARNNEYARTIHPSGSNHSTEINEILTGYDGTTRLCRRGSELFVRIDREIETEGWSRSYDSFGDHMPRFDRDTHGSFALRTEVPVTVEVSPDRLSFTRVGSEATMQWGDDSSYILMRTNSTIADHLDSDRFLTMDRDPALSVEEFSQGFIEAQGSC